jgi:DNA-binding NtrC family response regulator
VTEIKKQLGSAAAACRAGSRRLLLIDDFAQQYARMFGALERYGYATDIEDNPAHAIAAIERYKPDVVLLDLHFPEDDLDVSGQTTGARLLANIQEKYPKTPMVIFTDKLTDDRLELGTLGSQRHYAKDQITLLQKAGEDWAADLAATLDLAIAEALFQKQNLGEVDAEMGFVVGNTPQMRAVVEAIMKAAPTDLTVLIEGETGTGKELVARAIHKLSGRKELSNVNCSGVHEDTLDSQLFGHERGAFTDAVATRKGLFEDAEGGTVFLDEIQAMPGSLQNKLMRVVQEKQITRMGSNKPINVDVRLIIATNKPAHELVARGLLREDLYERLKVLAITLPPLRSRKSDIPLLWDFLIRKANESLKKHVLPNLRREVRELLEGHDWPRNIRELENVIFRALVHAKGNIILPGDIIIDPAGSATGKETAPAAQQPVGAVHYFPDPAKHGGGRETSAGMARITQLPPGQRWEFIINDTAGDSRKNLLLEIIASLRADHSSKRVSFKEITEFLCGACDDEEFRKYYDKVRGMFSVLKISLTKLD